MKPIRFVVVFAVTLLWAVVGLVFWLPLLCRSVVLITLAILGSAKYGVSIQRAQAALSMAVGFYFAGFARARQLLHAEEFSDEESTEKAPPLIRIFGELLFALLFWLTTLMTFTFDIDKLDRLPLGPKILKHQPPPSNQT